MVRCQPHSCHPWRQCQFSHLRTSPSLSNSHAPPYPPVSHYPATNAQSGGPRSSGGTPGNLSPRVYVPAPLPINHRAPPPATQYQGRTLHETIQRLNDAFTRLGISNYIQDSCSNEVRTRVIQILGDEFQGPVFLPRGYGSLEECVDFGILVSLIDPVLVKLGMGDVRIVARLGASGRELMVSVIRSI